jgi:hypothetical protein
VLTTDPTPVTLPSTHGASSQGITLNASHSSGSRSITRDGQAKIVPPDLSALSIKEPTTSTVDIATGLPVTSHRPSPLEGSHSTSNAVSIAASTQPAFGISTTQSSGKSLWEQAADSLSPKEQAFIKEHVTTAISSHTDFDTIYQDVQEKKKKFQEDRWKITFNGHEFVLCDVADRVCAWLDKLKQIGDIAVNVDPLHAGLPWAGIRLLLQV